MSNISFSNNYNHSLSIDSVVALYNSGMSVKAISEKLGFSRNAIVVRLHKAGIKQRNRSESMYNRMSKSTKEDKIKIVQKANEAMRNASKESINKRLAKSAIKKFNTKSKVGILEEYFIDKLRNIGLNPISQFPLHVYNIDIAFGNIAIEIHNSFSRPESQIHIRKRIIYLLKSGWIPVYVKFRYNTIINPITFDKIKTLFNLSRSNPAFIGHYWVIGSTGETISVGCLNGDDIANIPISENPFNMLDIDIS